MKYPIGIKKDNGNLQIAVRFPSPLFHQIIRMAKNENPPKDFNAMVLELVKCGKLCLDESDAMEIRNERGC
jgi:hypothetical protein